MSLLDRLRLRHLPTQPLSEVCDGAIARVAGTVSCDGTARVSPLSGVPCAWYRLRVFGALHAFGRTLFGVILDERAGATAVIGDETGHARVNLDDAEVRIERVYHQIGNDSQAHLARLVAGKIDGEWHPVLAREWVVLPGTRVAVAGQCLWEPARGELSFVSPAPLPLRVTALDD
jgi:hypothetical protein